MMLIMRFSMTSFALYRLLLLFLLLLATSTQAKYMVRSNAEWALSSATSSGILPITNDTTTITIPSTERHGRRLGRTQQQQRCNKTDVCFNNPGYLNGFHMYKVTKIRNGFVCKSVCVPTGACLGTSCTGNVFFVLLEYKHLLGWECGKCPQQKGISSSVADGGSNAMDGTPAKAPP